MSDIRQSMNGLYQRVRSDLPDVNGMSQESLALVLLTYNHNVGLYYPQWLAMVMMRSGDVGHRVCADFLLSEIQDNRRSKLRALVEPVRRLVENADLVPCISQTGCPQTFCEINGLHGLAVLAGLEYASYAFIVWMRDAAKKLHIQGSEYLHVRGGENYDRAKRLVDAIEAEDAAVRVKVSVCNNVAYATFDFVHAIFHVHERHLPRYIGRSAYEGLITGRGGARM